MTAWIITKDKIADPTEREASNCNAKGLTGPSTATEADVKRLQAGEGKRFRMLDDDGEIYYYGRQLETSECTEAYETGYYGSESDFAPLDNFGAPNAGCTELQFDNGVKDSKGKVVWETL
jgi:hypothetical protein